MARPVPVLPDVGSTMVPPGLSLPSRSAASMSATATRSLIEPPGLSASTLATICGVRPAPRRDRRTSGVSPMASRIESLMSTVEAVVGGAHAPQCGIHAASSRNDRRSFDALRDLAADSSALSATMAAVPNDGLDDVDRRLLELLAADARISNARLAAAVGVAPSTALARVRALRDARGHPRLPRRGRPRRPRAPAAGARRHPPLGPLARADRVLHRARAHAGRRALDLPRDRPDRLPAVGRRRRRPRPARVRRRAPRLRPRRLARRDLAHLRAAPRARACSAPTRPSRAGAAAAAGRPRWRRKRWNSRAMVSPLGRSCGLIARLLLLGGLLEALDEGLHVGVALDGERDLALVVGGGGLELARVDRDADEALELAHQRERGLRVGGGGDVVRAPRPTATRSARRPPGRRRGARRRSRSGPRRTMGSARRAGRGPRRRTGR